jgi:hypothetical protein
MFPTSPRNTLPAETPPAPLVLVMAAVWRWVGLMLLLLLLLETSMQGVQEEG